MKDVEFVSDDKSPPAIDKATISSSASHSKPFLRPALRRNLELLSMNLPTILVLVVFSYIPMIGLILAFKDYNFRQGIFGSPWIGLKNFEFLIRSTIAWRITRNTIGMNTIFITASTIASLTLGIFLNELRRRSVKTYQTLLFIPQYLSFVVVGYLVLAFLDMELGMVNNLLVRFGKEPVLWYAEIKYWPFILTAVSVWRNAGYGAIIYYTAIMGISSEMYEAAEIDGASRIQQIWHITLPLLKPTVIMLTLLALGRIIRADFGLFYFVPNNAGILYPVTDVIDTYVFRTLRTIGDINMSAAASFYQSIVGFVLVVTANWMIRRYDRESAIF